MTVAYPLSSYLNAIQTCCPHIQCYMTAAVITNKRRQTLLKDLIRVIRQVGMHGLIPEHIPVHDIPRTYSCTGIFLCPW